MSAELDELLDVMTSLPGGVPYPPADRYHDFRRVFLGTDEGRRVLREIVAWGRLLRAPAMSSPIDTSAFLIQEGERNIVRRLLSTVTTEPPKQTERANRRAEP